MMNQRGDHKGPNYVHLPERAKSRRRRAKSPPYSQKRTKMATTTAEDVTQNLRITVSTRPATNFITAKSARCLGVMSSSQSWWR